MWHSGTFQYWMKHTKAMEGKPPADYGQLSPGKTKPSTATMHSNSMKPTTYPYGQSRRRRQYFFKILDMKDEATQKIWTDQPGHFPKKSSKGSQYMMVLTESESNAIFVEAMKNKTSGEMIRAYQVLINQLHSVGITPKQHILDNECSNDFKEAIKTNNMTYQLVLPHDH
jgi:hypothetical protein